MASLSNFLIHLPDEVSWSLEELRLWNFRRSGGTINQKNRGSKGEIGENVIWQIYSSKKGTRSFSHDDDWWREEVGVKMPNIDYAMCERPLGLSYSAKSFFLFTYKNIY